MAERPLKWRCKSCGEYHPIFSVEPPRACEKCGGTEFEPFDRWRCLRCGEELEMAHPKRPVVCPNPNCGKRGPFEALTGPFRFFDRDKFIPGRLAEEIKARRRFLTHIKSYTIWAFKNNGYYTPDGEAIIAEEVRRTLGTDLVKENYVTEVIHHIQETTFAPPEAFEPPANLINLKNGVLNLDTGELGPHDGSVVFINEIPVEYRPGAECPAVMEFLEQILNKEDIPVIQEIVGYCLLRDYRFAKAVMFLGDGANGKSTLLNLIASFLGRENVATPALQDLIEDPFSRADLYGKLANIHADLPAIRLKHTGIFKMLTGQDLIWANVKHKKPFTFRNYAKLLYSANELPATNDTSEAFWRRWLLITFPNTFPDGDPKTDPNILSKLTTPEELSGMLNWALEGLRRLLKQGHFTYTKTQSEVEEEWVARTDSLRAFVKKYARKSTGHYVTKESFYAAYSAFCEENESTPIEKAAVGRRLPTLLPGIIEFHPAEENKQKRAWKGIALLPPYNIYHKQAAITEITLFSRESDITDMTEKRYMETNSNKKDNIYNNQKNTVISVILVKIKVLADIPYTIVGADGKTYGPFRAGDVAEIPRENALLLAHKGLVEIQEEMKGLEV